MSEENITDFYTTSGDSETHSSDHYSDIDSDISIGEIEYIKSVDPKCLYCNFNCNQYTSIVPL